MKTLPKNKNPILIITSVFDYIQIEMFKSSPAEVRNPITDDIKICFGQFDKSLINY